MVLIRHGQASAKEAVYDQLSPLGYEQSRVLGIHLRSQPWHPSVVCMGPRLRHRQTWETLRLQGIGWPDASKHEALDELPAEQIMMNALPILLQPEHSLSELAHQLVMGGGLNAIAIEDVQRVLAGAMALWMADELDDSSMETWSDFKRRVHQTLEGLVTHAGAGQPAVGVTSAGFISAAIGLIHGQSPSEIRQAMFRIPNASIVTLEREGQAAVWRVLEPPSDAYLSEEQRSWI